MESYWQFHYVCHAHYILALNALELYAVRVSASKSQSCRVRLPYPGDVNDSGASGMIIYRRREMHAACYSVGQRFEITVEKITRRRYRISNVVLREYEK